MEAYYGSMEAYRVLLLTPLKVWDWQFRASTRNGNWVRPECETSDFLWREDFHFFLTADISSTTWLCWAIWALSSTSRKPHVTECFTFSQNRLSMRGEFSWSFSHNYLSVAFFPFLFMHTCTFHSLSSFTVARRADLTCFWYPENSRKNCSTLTLLPTYPPKSLNKIRL